MDLGENKREDWGPFSSSPLKPEAGLRAPKSQACFAACKSLSSPLWKEVSLPLLAIPADGAISSISSSDCAVFHNSAARELKGRDVGRSALVGSASILLGQPGTPKGCHDSLLPWQVVTGTTCPGLSLHKYTVQMLHMIRDYLPASQKLLFNVHWICVLPWPGHKYRKQWIIFNFSWDYSTKLIIMKYFLIFSHAAPFFKQPLCICSVQIPTPLISHCFDSSSPSWRGRFKGVLRGGYQASHSLSTLVLVTVCFGWQGPGSLRPPPLQLHPALLPALLVAWSWITTLLSFW